MFFKLKGGGKVQGKKIKTAAVFLFFCFFVLTVAAGQGATAAEIREAGRQDKSKSVLTDRAGKQIILPANIKRIVSLAPSNTKILLALGLKEKIIAADTYSKAESLPHLENVFDIMFPDTEKLIMLKPDIIISSGLSSAKGKDVFRNIREAGICIAEIPSANSIEGIYSDINFFGKIFSEENKALKLISEIKSEISAIKKITAAIPVQKRKKVYFEIAAAPNMYSFGTNTFLHEMLEIAGAENILKKQKGWVSVSEEFVIAENPDVILTNTDYIKNPAEEILKRRGWASVKAVKNKKVFVIDKNDSSQPCQNIVKALKQIAASVYPEYFMADFQNR